MPLGAIIETVPWLEMRGVSGERLKIWLHSSRDLAGSPGRTSSPASGIFFARRAVSLKPFAKAVRARPHSLSAAAVSPYHCPVADRVRPLQTPKREVFPSPSSSGWLYSWSSSSITSPPLPSAPYCRRPLPPPTPAPLPLALLLSVVFPWSSSSVTCPPLPSIPRCCPLPPPTSAPLPLALLSSVGSRLPDLRGIRSGIGTLLRDGCHQPVRSRPPHWSHSAGGFCRPAVANSLPGECILHHHIFDSQTFDSQTTLLLCNRRPPALPTWRTRIGKIERGYRLGSRSSGFLSPSSSSSSRRLPLRAVRSWISRVFAGTEASGVVAREQLSNMRDIVEYAKSARAACKASGCGTKIEKGCLRVGRITKGDGGFDVTRWFHPRCYFKTSSEGENGASCVEAIVGFNLLKVADQNLLHHLEKEGKGVEDGSRSPKRRKLDSSYPLQSEPSSPCVVNEMMTPTKAANVETKEVDRAGWEAILAGFSGMQLSSVYKGAILPKGWKAFQSVIIWEGNDVKPSHKIASFDFDGCLVNTSVRRHGADSWSLLYPTVPQTLQKLHEDGFKLVIFTNESNIDRWVNSRQKAIDSKIGRVKGLAEKVKVPIQVFIACAKNGTRDPCRKPGIGMWELMERYFNGGMEIDKSLSFFVGDAAGRHSDFSSSDRDFAKEVNIEFLLPENVFRSDGKPEGV
ncbi:hypothetical protein CBR_g66772 [Chara braunii]|uniref:PARP-type domain-containing protein n=1 Tax=Chara braunii TaxID=69332 RepID=A0A388K9D5_CHABU|nr:hypothetical protein CBR_g66772 [Chara braunii]|eukprot:GBG66636.1 hypothetical protein CBR_g66772 [Chara braunii]